MWFRYKLYGDVNYVYKWMESNVRHDNIDVTRTTTDSLRKFRSSKYYGTRRVWEVVIGANILAGKGTDWTYIKNIYKAVVLEIHESTDSLTQPTNGWIPVEREGGAMPVEYVEGMDALPSVTLTLFEMQASY